MPINQCNRPPTRATQLLQLTRLQIVVLSITHSTSLGSIQGRLFVHHPLDRIESLRRAERETIEAINSIQRGNQIKAKKPPHGTPPSRSPIIRSSSIAATSFSNYGFTTKSTRHRDRIHSIFIRLLSPAVREETKERVSTLGNYYRSQSTSAHVLPIRILPACPLHSRNNNGSVPGPFNCDNNCHFPFASHHSHICCRSHESHQGTDYFLPNRCVLFI